MPARAKPSRIVQPASASVADHSIDPHPDPDAAATGDGLFGLSTAPSDARIVVIPVPFDATTSYRPRTARGPAAILEASKQVDLEDLQYGAIGRAGIGILPISREIAALSSARKAAEPVLTAGGAVPGNRTHARNSARGRERSKRASTRSSPVKRARSSQVAPD